MVRPGNAKEGTVPQRELRVSVRLMWPFLRILSSSPSPVASELLARVGIQPADLARPDTRLPHRLMMDMLAAWVESTGDHTVGIRAGASIESGDLDTLEQVARSCSTLREALECIGRYFHILNEAVELSIVDEGEHALWRSRPIDGPTPRAANDFIVVASARFSMRCAQIHRPAREVHFMHASPADLDSYSAFSGSVLRFGMPHNGFVLDRELLDRPTRGGNARMRAAFETYARELADRNDQGIRGRAREEIRARLGTKDMCMEAVAAALAMSVPTLRRRLEDDDTTFSNLVDDVRRDLAGHYLRDPNRSIGEIASLLGFSHAPAFHKAYRRWTGATPSEHRAQIGQPRGGSERSEDQR